MNLTGTYRLLSCEVQWSDGAVDLPYGTSPEGLLVYAESGHFSGHLMRRGVAKFGTGARQVPPEQAKEAFLGYLGYYGTYTVDESAGTVTHHVLGSWHPNWVGTDQVRHFQFDGDQLVIKTPQVGAGGRSHHTLLVWRRANSG